MKCRADSIILNMIPINIEHLGNDYGERLKYAKNFNGPKGGRSCTDVFCLMLFVIFLIFWIFIGSFAYREGDINRTLVPTDSSGLKCGLDSEVVDKPYLMFFDILKCIDPMVPIYGCPTTQVCVQQCPREIFEYQPTQCNAGTIASIKEKLICTRGVNIPKISTCDQLNNLMQNERCAHFYWESDSYMQRCFSIIPESRCPRELRKLVVRQMALIPENSSDGDCNHLRDLSNTLLTEKFHQFNLIEEMQYIVADIYQMKMVITVSLLLATLCCMLLIAVMRWIATFLLWLSIYGFITLICFGIYYSDVKYRELRNYPQRPDFGTNLKVIINNYMKSECTWFVLLIILCMMLVVLLLVVLVLRKRIRIAIELVKEGSKAVTSTYSTLFFPLFPWMLQIIVIIFSSFVAILLLSVGDPVYVVSGLVSDTKCVCADSAKLYVDGASCDPRVFHDNCTVGPQKDMCTQAACHFNEIRQPDIISFYQVVNVVACFWALFFASSLGEMVLAATFATWYWTIDKSKMPFFTLTRALGITLRYHLGTLVFGSLILTVCRMFRVFLEYVSTKLKKYDNRITQSILRCMKCFFWCVEKFLRYINQNAYIMCAMHGTNFCTSARDSFNLLMRNFLRVYAVDKVTTFAFFLAKLLITMGVGAATYMYLESVPSEIPLNYIIVPPIIVMIGTYLISTMCFGVYSMAVDTLFLCFLEDCERNNGSLDKPYFMSTGLMRILGNRNDETLQRIE